ncbi:MAG TPA: hypothetical protein EYO84_05545, partial [Planctomycetes bacterium]|nr:hypothetical protein [Planctomycetota bacterium]
MVDSLNRGIRFRDPEGNTTYVDLDSRNNVVARYDAVAGLGLIPFEDPCLGTTDNLVSNLRGNGVFTFFDGANRPWMTRYEMHLGGTGTSPLDTSNPFIPSGIFETVTERDANSRLSKRIDGMGNITSFNHDLFNRKTGRTHADGGSRSWSFDLDHQLTGSTDENGSEHAFENDAIGRRLSHIITPAATIIGGTAFPMLIGSTEQTWQYNGRSQITRCTDNNDPADPDDDAIVICTPDSLGRWVHEEQDGNSGIPLQGGAGSGDVSWGYSSDDLAQFIYPDGREIFIGSDDHDQFSFLFDDLFRYTECLMGDCCCDAAKTTWETFDDVSGNFEETYRETQTLDANQLPLSTTLTSTSGAIEGGFSIDGRRGDLQVTACSQNYGSTATGGPTLQFNTLNLDSLDRTEVIGTDDSLGNFQVQFVTTGAAQAIRNIEGFGSGPSGSVDIFRDLPRDEVHQIDLPEYQQDGSPGNGNRTADAEHYYQWDGFNRLRTVISRATLAVIASYRYDAHPAIFGGRRIEKTITNSPIAGLDGTTHFYYDGA